jgi:hypothetical protein
VFDPQGLPIQQDPDARQGAESRLLQNRSGRKVLHPESAARDTVGTVEFLESFP